MEGQFYRLLEKFRGVSLEKEERLLFIQKKKQRERGLLHTKYLKCMGGGGKKFRVDDFYLLKQSSLAKHLIVISILTVTQDKGK
jgi:hypothetical protein